MFQDLARITFVLGNLMFVERILRFTVYPSKQMMVVTWSLQEDTS
jgi:hypothetical protein